MLLRLVVTGLLFALTCIPCHAVSKESARDKNAFVGPVQTVTTKLSLLSITENYDRAGNLLEAISYSDYDKTSTRHVFTYNQKGDLQEEAAYDSEGTLIYRKHFAYGFDSEGRETAVVAASQDGTFNHGEFLIHDSKGLLSESLFYTGSMIYRSVFDALGHIIYSATFREGQLLYERKWAYDNKGGLIGLFVYSPTGIITGQTRYERDDSGKLVREITEQFADGLKSKWATTYEYDNMGNWIKKSMNQENGGPEGSSKMQSRVVEERVIVYYENR